MRVSCVRRGPFIWGARPLMENAASARPEITGSYNFITHNAARTLNLSDYGIEVGNTANFIVLDAEDWFHALSFGAPVLANVRAGRVLAECEPLARRVHF